jgi:hypothetical protein
MFNSNSTARTKNNSFVYPAAAICFFSLKNKIKYTNTAAAI